MCDHTFVYHSVIPPSHCPKCGCAPPTWSPQPWYGPYPYMITWPATYTQDHT